MWQTSQSLIQAAKIVADPGSERALRLDNFGRLWSSAALEMDWGLFRYRAATGLTSWLMWLASLAGGYRQASPPHSVQEANGDFRSARAPIPQFPLNCQGHRPGACRANRARTENLHSQEVGRRKRNSSTTVSPWAETSWVRGVRRLQSSWHKFAGRNAARLHGGLGYARALPKSRAGLRRYLVPYVFGARFPAFARDLMANGFWPWATLPKSDIVFGTKSPHSNACHCARHP